MLPFAPNSKSTGFAPQTLCGETSTGEKFLLQSFNLAADQVDTAFSHLKSSLLSSFVRVFV